MRVDYPGIGGSLGECVICGKDFALEVMLGRTISTAKLEGFERELPMHKKCLDAVPEDMSWEKLPDGPLRREFAEHFEKIREEMP